MSLTKLDTRESDSKKDLLFQIRCRPERIGQEFCNSEEVSGLLTEFKTIAYKINQKKPSPGGKWNKCLKLFRSLQSGF